MLNILFFARQGRWKGAGEGPFFERLGMLLAVYQRNRPIE